MGEYAATDQYQYGRQVYKHINKELYLAVKLIWNSAELRCSGGWVVDWGRGYRSYSPILHSQTAPTLCPADPQAAGTWGGWMGWWYEGPSFVPPDSIVVKCLIH